MLPQHNFFWSRIDNKHMTEPWLDQALMESAYSVDKRNIWIEKETKHVLKKKNTSILEKKL